MPDPGICQDGPLREREGNARAAETNAKHITRSAAADVAKRPVTQRTLSVFKLESPMKVFTTGQVAKICKVAPRTVSKWFDSGRLKGYRIPGSQDRRIPREYLIKFLKEHGMPLGDLEDEAMAKVLIVAQDQVLIENMKRELPVERAFRTTTAASGFEAGIQAESFHPDCIIVDFSIGQLEALQICQNLRRNSEFSETILIALLPDDSSTANFDRSSINETFKKPFDAALLAERLRTLIGAKKELV
jgi:excisionase family DNA binding protein